MKQETMAGNFKKLVLFLGLTAIILILMRYFFPEQSAVSVEVMKNYSIEIALIFPPVLVLMGLADVWIPEDMVKNYLGKTSGWKGILLSLFLGTLPTGPLFIAFPVAAEMLKKGARISNVVVFLGAWASLKMPQIGVEIQFLGLKFAFYRAILAFIAVISIALITEKMILRSELNLK